jgi:hypothetical protein
LSYFSYVHINCPWFAWLQNLSLFLSALPGCPTEQEKGNDSSYLCLYHRHMGLKIHLIASILFCYSNIMEEIVMDIRKGVEAKKRSKIKKQLYLLPDSHFRDTSFRYIYFIYDRYHIYIKYIPSTWFIYIYIYIHLYLSIIYLSIYVFIHPSIYLYTSVTTTEIRIWCQLFLKPIWRAKCNATVFPKLSPEETF